jgi:formylglycine-generating enzyme required for sulfatase activity
MGMVVDPLGPENGTHRVLRGGSWNYIAQNCRSACRYGGGPTLRDDDAGFRCVLVR